MFENDLLSRKGMLVKELAQEIRTLQTAHRPQGVHVSSGCQPMDRCLPSGGYAAGSLLELTCKHKPRTSGWGGLSLALKIAKPWLDDGKYLVVVDSHRRLCAPSLVALKIPLERLIVIRSENAADWVWGLDQALRSPAVGALISPVNELDDRSASICETQSKLGGGSVAGSIRIDSNNQFLFINGDFIAIERPIGTHGALVRLGTASRTGFPKHPTPSFGNRCSRRVETLR
ncbi:MAG: hypothetical protein LW850_12100 [Planctomycetaceae bacterium]|nr:hypothetical protein [Planctomycetaceae bacterium]